MECYNKYCLWNGFEQCCHESEEGHDIATPNMFDCPSSLRFDLQEQHTNMQYRVIRKLRNLDFKSMNEVEQLVDKKINERLLRKLALDDAKAKGFK